MNWQYVFVSVAIVVFGIGMTARSISRDSFPILGLVLVVAGLRLAYVSYRHVRSDNR